MGRNAQFSIFILSMSEDTTDVRGYATLLRELKDTDADTGLLTRTSLCNRLMQELARCERYGNKLSVAGLRIVGDDGDSDLSRRLGEYLGSNVRNVDYAARWSDREFLVVLPETDEQGARLFAAKITPILKDLPEDDHGRRITIETTVYARGDDMSGLLSRLGF